MVSRKGKGGKIFESIFDFIRTSKIGSHFSNLDYGLQQKVSRNERNKLSTFKLFGFWYFSYVFLGIHMLYVSLFILNLVFVSWQVGERGEHITHLHISDIVTFETDISDT